MGASRAGQRRGWSRPCCPNGCSVRSALTEQITHLGKLSHQYGSGRVREQVVQLLHREANQLLHGSYSPDDRPRPAVRRREGH